MLTPIKAIRAKCIDCCCGQRNEVKVCTLEKCALHPYRMGKRPKMSNSSTDAVNSEKTQAISQFLSVGGDAEC